MVLTRESGVCRHVTGWRDFIASLEVGSILLQTDK
jgi:hypothetical protein